ncbi:MAG: DNA recombination protein RmuC [Bacilli bacterium]|jgi:DNA recombination protein RmuC|nr:DNA recombination protein RmuC [Bacilli bacterium]
MEYVILGMLGIIIVLLLVMMLKKRNDADIVDRMSKLELQVVKEIGEFKIGFTNDLRNDFDKLDEKIERKLMEINNKVTERLDQSLEKTNRTFASVLERLSKIDEAQKKIDGLSSDIISLQSVLTDKKTRGIFGEVNLSFILENAFGGTSSGIYSLQHKMSNGFIADALLFAPAPLGTIAIDSKFPLENYERMTNKNISLEERTMYEKQFKIDFKKHIDAISSKYIIPGETAGEAMLFLPAEAIFAEVNAYHRDILDYAYSKKVWITSPTTIMSMLTIISMVLKNMERDKYAQVIHEELNKLSLEFSRYKERWDKLARNIKTVSNSVEELNTTSDKITKRFDSINKVEVDKLINENKELVNS